jgi:hypothetical protein
VSFVGERVNSQCIMQVQGMLATYRLQLCIHPILNITDYRVVASRILCT